MYSLSEASTLQHTEQNFVLSSSVFRSTIASLRSAIRSLVLKPNCDIIIRSLVLKPNCDIIIKIACWSMGGLAKLDTHAPPHILTMKNDR